MSRGGLAMGLEEGGSDVDDLDVETDRGRAGLPF
jgi:hypothetical protein